MGRVTLTGLCDERYCRDGVQQYGSDTEPNDLPVGSIRVVYEIKLMTTVPDSVETNSMVYRL